MFSFFSPYKLLIEAIAIGAIILGIGYGIHKFLSYEQNLGYQKAVAEYTAKELEATKAAREKETALTKQLQEAQNAAQIREQAIKSMSAAVNAASVSLRDTLNNISRGVPTATIAALRQSTTALSAVLVECQDNYRGMAEKADRHASDVKTLSDAWPK